MKILVVEDHPLELKLASLVLSEAGCSVTCASSAEEALASIGSDRPKIILLDMNMPGMDGLNLVHRLKSDPEMRDIQVVAVTSYPEKYSKSEVIGAGCEAYLSKPISTRTLAAELRKLIDANEENSLV